eukprot:TRINITY_DN763_c1_g1_i1.p2 TRINITY_DN763_c1_g1~~TRINITY_DN763_c1_g1_i1.p2  ORF type:complete len:146 (-),score=12.23 TRINITY_DN763_c1_g1_i1:59-496(-)
MRSFFILRNLQILQLCIVTFCQYGRAQSNYDEMSCAEAVQKFSDNFQIVDSRQNVNSLMYMFHIPKTAGRTFNSCLWKCGVPPQARCSRAYDWLHLDEHPYNCKVLASHDDYSINRFLPDKVQYVTVFREPTARFISAYEFALTD